jgi:hypothetical protein
MQRSSLFWLILAAILASAALAWWTLNRGYASHPSRAVVVEHRDLPPFHAIEVGGAAELTRVQGDGESLDVETSRRGRVAAHVENGRLMVSAADRRRWWSGLFGRRATGPPTIVVRFRTLDAIALSGNVKLSIPKLETPSLRIAASGGSELSIDELRAATLRVSGSGALKARLAGAVDEEHVSISGAGSYQAEDLRAADANVSVSGVGRVLVRAERTLRANISGAGVIEYVGDPAVTEHVSGVGRVKRRESSVAPGMRIPAAPQ